MADLNVKISGFGLLAFDKAFLKKVMGVASREIAAQAKSYIKPGGSGRRYPGIGGSKGALYQASPHRASAPGDAPASVTGRLRKSIVARPFASGEGFAVIDRQYYSAALEKGATGGSSNGRGVTKRDRKVKRQAKSNKVRRLAPRPFLTRALEAKRSSVEARITAAIEQGIAFEKQKVIK